MSRFRFILHTVVRIVSTFSTLERWIIEKVLLLDWSDTSFTVALINCLLFGSFVALCMYTVLGSAEVC